MAGRRRGALTEIELLPGLTEVVEAEARGLGFTDIRSAGKSRLRGFAPTMEAATNLRTAVASYVVIPFEVPRPKALLGNENLSHLAEATRYVRDHSKGFTALRLGGAGKDSAVFARLAEELGKAIGLPVDAAEGDLVIRIVRGADHGWEALIRLTPRPLSTRAWRVADMRGALNATIAAAMVSMVPHARHAVNLMCGSATLAIEHLDQNGGRAVGIEIDDGPMAAARENVAAAGVADVMRLVKADVGNTPLRDNCTSVVYCDLPYGDAMGSSADNKKLYPQVIAEATRILRPGGYLVAVTNDIQKFERLLSRADGLTEEHSMQVFQKGHNPKIWVLRQQ